MSLIPSVMSTWPSAQGFQFFEDDLPHPDALHAELHQWFAVWEGAASEKPDSLSDTMKCCDAKYFPNIKAIARICCTFPITSAECERCMSVLRLLKTYLRSTMGGDRFTSLALMYVHRLINQKQVVAEFARRQPRKILLPNILNEL